MILKTIFLDFYFSVKKSRPKNSHIENKFAASFLTGLIGSSLGFNLLTIYYNVGNPVNLSSLQDKLIIFMCIAPFAYIFYKKGDTYLEDNKEHCYSNKRIFNFFLVVVLTSPISVLVLNIVES